MMGWFVTSSRKVLVALSAGVLAVLVSATAAWAHVDPDPPAVQAGTKATVQLGIEHGCGTSPTTAVAMKIPATIIDAKPVGKAGWTSEVAGGEIRYTGGSLDAATADHFDLTFTAPATPGPVTIPVVQTCTVGENAWIDVVTEGKPEPEHPAPVIKITAGPPTAADLAPASDDGGATHDHDESHTGLIVGLVIAAVVVVGAGGALVLRAKRRKQPPV
jgi:uncharacterized protein YcnI